MRNRVLRLSLWAAALAAPLAAAHDIPKGLVGLLTPEPVSANAPGCPGAGAADALPLRSRPDDEAAVIGTVAFRPIGNAPQDCELAFPVFETPDASGSRPVPALESSYEEPALLALEKRGDWLRIDLGDRSAWLRSPAGYRFEAYPAILAQRLAYATPAWAGEICAIAGDDCGRIEPSPEQALRILGVAAHDGQDWMEVELTTDPCRDVEERVLMRGWIRAHATDGRPAAWFHSRGC